MDSHRAAILLRPAVETWTNCAQSCDVRKQMCDDQRTIKRQDSVLWLLIGLLHGVMLSLELQAL